NYTKIWETIASDILSIEPGMVRINHEQESDCGPSCASRNITVVTEMVEKCCHIIRKKRFHNPLPLTARHSTKPQKGALLQGSFLPPDGKVFDINGFLKPGFACAVVEVYMDMTECVPKIRGVWLAVAGGKIISANRAKRNLTRGIIQALGWAFTEHIEYKNGSIPKSQYNNFTIPNPANIPSIYIDFLADNSGETRGVGELPFTCVPAAFLQAVSQAMDHSFKSIPVRRKEIWEMVKLRHAETPGHK
ncbi:MAG: molybdopterin-dependent oxidoreductase, partial [Treponema sp.]|nr:molybdopterin-dependent oxidoreductase [Treponema sp.]